MWSDKLRGQNALFGAVAGDEDSSGDEHLPDVPAWSQAEISRQEKASVGFYLSVHPLDDYKNTLADLRIMNIADYEEIKPGDNIVLAGIVSGAQVKYSKKGNRFCILRFEDQSSGVKCLAWAEAFAKYADLLKDDELLIIEARVESTEGQEVTVILNEARRIADAVPLRAREVSITLPYDTFNELYFEELFTLLSKNHGKCEVLLNFMTEEKVFLKLRSQPLRIQGSSVLEKELKSRGCSVNWIL
jgi:DNA polymerase-3 subunit alpha